MYRDRNHFLDFIKKDSPVIAEVGVEYGGYTDIYINMFYNPEIYLVDLWSIERNDDPYFKNNPQQLEIGYNKILTKYGDDKRVKICKGHSDDWCDTFEDGTFDWVYIDANHTYEAAKNDILKWLPKVKKGGVLSGHDFNPDPNNIVYDTFGVDRAVKEIFGNSFNLTNDYYYKTWYVTI